MAIRREFVRRIGSRILVKSCPGGYMAAGHVSCWPRCGATNFFETFFRIRLRPESDAAAARKLSGVDELTIGANVIISKPC